MRNDIYYWKCDSPHTAQEKRKSFFKDKYDRADLTEAVMTACRSAFGGDPYKPHLCASTATISPSSSPMTARNTFFVRTMETATTTTCLLRAP